MVGKYILPAHSAATYKVWPKEKVIWTYKVGSDFGERQPSIRETVELYNSIKDCKILLTYTNANNPDIYIDLWDDKDARVPEITNCSYKDGFTKRCQINLYSSVLNKSAEGKNRENYYTNAVLNGLGHVYWGPPHTNGGLMSPRLSTDKVYWRGEKTFKKVLRKLYAD